MLPPHITANENDQLHELAEIVPRHHHAFIRVIQGWHCLEADMLMNVWDFPCPIKGVAQTCDNLFDSGEVRVPQPSHAKPGTCEQAQDSGREPT